jgi:RNA polymerase sigma factor (sigma-70 family)
VVQKKDDFSALIQAFIENDERRIKALLLQLYDRLEMYLRVVYDCDTELAKDIVQTVMKRVIKKINDDAIRDSKSLLSYCMISCKNQFFHLVKDENQRRMQTVELDEQLVPDHEHALHHLLSKERMRILNDCIQGLNELNRRLIEFLLAQPDASNSEIEQQFQLSYASARTRKTRIIQALHDCYLQYSKK